MTTQSDDPLDDIPFVSLSTEQMKNTPLLGTEYLCPNCSKFHNILSNRGNLGSTIETIECPESTKSYMVGFNGREITLMVKR